jgi:hypothetical protein
MMVVAQVRAVLASGIMSSKDQGISQHCTIAAAASLLLHASADYDDNALVLAACDLFSCVSMVAQSRTWQHVTNIFLDVT